MCEGAVPGEPTSSATRSSPAHRLGCLTILQSLIIVSTLERIMREVSLQTSPQTLLATAHCEYLVIFHKAVMEHWSNEPREEEIHEKNEKAKDEGEDPCEESQVPGPMELRD